ncbi:MAG TPA: hypothetical protein VNU01_04220, partial [Egibacteraceae bacterium]|nr:hypothetical protein [Egibacteraceae bacterium]
PAAASCVPPLMRGYTTVDDPMPHGDGHDHADPAQHRLARNATLLAVDDLRRFGWTETTVVGAHALARHGDLLAVAVNGGRDGSQQGFHLFDVSVADAPRHLGMFEAGVSVAGDRTIAFSHDGRTVFLGYEGAARPGVAAVDVSDPSRPRETHFWRDPQGFGSHTVSAGTIDGVQHVFSLAAGINILRYDPSGFQLVGKYVTADGLGFLDAPGSSTGIQTYVLRSLYGHDMDFYLDAVTGKPLLLVAYAYDGAKILDLSVPSAPVLQARWRPPPAADHAHYTHSAVAERSSDGRLLWVVGSETFEQENQGIASPIWILDATDAVAAPPLAAAPEHLATWRNPGGSPAGHLGSSVHFFRLQQGLLYLSHYHGGIWAFDLRDSGAWRDVRAFGHILPVGPDPVAPPEGCCINYDLGRVPMVFDVEAGAEPGVAYGADLVQGLSVVRFDVPAGA